jgi:putative GTP pyrophosphokinase
MAFPLVPKESKNQINKAGRILLEAGLLSKEFELALDIAERWRACHAYPINTFQSTLRVKLKDFPQEPIVAQRLKRMPTIINKLERFPAMSLTTMQDIGGVRAVLASITQVYELAYEYENTPFAHERINKKDYIESPRDEDGYRSLHLIYKYKNRRNSNYDGLRLELQIRSKLQHTWATAVETMGTFLGQALKSRQGDKEWIEFFAITSSAFAYMEKCPPVPRFKNLSQTETFKAVAAAELELRALEKMKGFSVAVNEIVKTKGSGKGQFYHLIILNSLQKTVQIKPYDRNNFQQAVDDYAKIEAEAAQGKKIEPVLVSAGPLGMLRRAYPNFFLDIGEFVNIVTQISDKAKQGES